MSEQSVPNLTALGIVSNPTDPVPAAPRTVSSEEEGMEALMALMESVNVSFQNMKEELQEVKRTNSRLGIELRLVKGRMATMETFISYLSMKDPGISERMAAMAAAAETAEKAAKPEQADATKQG